MKNLLRREWLWMLLIMLAAAAIRLPYWDIIPAANDEPEQTSFAYQIANGQIRPLTGNDAYAGPFFVYIVAGLIKLGATDPLTGRFVTLAAGILTIPVTWVWAQALGKNRLAALIAALLVAVNPDLILTNSHVGGTTFLLPFLTTLFLLCLTLANKRDSPGWVLLAGIAGGLAGQSNLVGGLAVAGGALWFLWQTRRSARLGKWWPLWPVLLGLVILAMLSPIILHNLTADITSADALARKPYIWEHDPSVATTINNARRFSLQLVRQSGGVLAGDEDFTTLIGIPLIYLALMIAGLVYTTRHVSTLPLLVFAPFALILPIISSHYGFGDVGRFTSLLIPVFAVVIAFLMAAMIDRWCQMPATPGRYIGGILLMLLALLLVVYPMVSLFRHYDQAIKSHTTGRALLELSRYPVANNRGEPVYISTIDELSGVLGTPYVPHAAFLLGDIYHEFLTPEQIIGRLYETPGPAFFMLSDRDAAVVGTTVVLERIAIPANHEASLQGYGLYRFTGSELLTKPDFVLDVAPAGLVSTTTFSDGVEMLGCEPPQPISAGETLILNCYWQADGELPPNRYVTFAHLIPADSGQLLAQDDHILGQELYPLNAWQPGEVIRETYALSIPPDAAVGEHRIVLGIYTWPDLNRLTVPDNPDNVVMLAPVRVE